MSYEIPERVSLIIKYGESQLDFAKRLFMEAAKIAGMPLLEQISFVNYMIKSGEQLFAGKDGKLRLKWQQDISPQDKNPLVSDSEWKAKYGKSHTHILGDADKRELKRQQVYYLLEGGVLGSMQEIPINSDIIVIDLNLIYQEEKFSLAEARSYFGEYVSDAVKVYEPLGIKFYINDWTPGTAVFNSGSDGNLDARITKGYIKGFYNVIFGRRAGNTSDERFSLSYTIFDSNSIPTASFIYQGALGGGSGVANYGLRTHSLAHELGHVFGLIGSADISIVGLKSSAIRNYAADWDVDKAILRLLGGNVKKGIDWRRSGLILPDASGKIEYLTVFDMLRAGARVLARKV